MTLRIKQRWVLVSDKDKDLGEELNKIFSEREPRLQKPDGSLSAPLGFLEARRLRVKPLVLPLAEVTDLLHKKMGYGKEISIPALKAALKEFVKDPANKFTGVRGRNGGITRY